MSWLRVGAAVALRPRLWPTALAQMRRTASPGWYRRRPFLPVPSGDYMKFRMITQYGDLDHRPQPHDVVNYLGWCRQWDSNRKSRR